MFSLLAEVNSIFLHGRKIFNLFHIPRENVFVRLNMVINIVTFFLCRLCMLFFVTIFVYHDRYRVGDFFYAFVTCILIPVMWIINPILFYRVLYIDFLKRYKKRQLMSWYKCFFFFSESLFCTIVDIFILICVYKVSATCCSSKIIVFIV